jgi:membrane protein required for colicin V production
MCKAKNSQFSIMNYLDIILIIPLAYGLVQGLRKGLVKEIAGLLAILFGIYLARYWALPVSQALVDLTGWTLNLCTPLAYAVVFIAVSLSITLLSYMLTKIIGAIMLGWLNRLLGGAFGIIKMLLLLSVILNFVAIVDQFMPVKEKPVVQNSLFYKPIEDVMGVVLPYLNFEDFTTAVREGIVEPTTKAIEEL